MRPEDDDRPSRVRKTLVYAIAVSMLTIGGFGFALVLNWSIAFAFIDDKRAGAIWWLIFGATALIGLVGLTLLCVRLVADMRRK